MMTLALTLALISQLSDNTITAANRIGDATLFGTRDGVFILDDSGDSRMIPGISGQVTAIASPYVATTMGIFRLDDTAAQIRGAEPLVSSLVVGARIYIGGKFGIAELNPTGATKKLIDTPVAAMVFSGDTLLAATRDGLFAFSDSWIPVRSAIGYSHIAGLGQRWLGLRPDGKIDIGSSASFTPLEFPFDEDPVTAIASLSDAKFLAGTWRGRILIGEISSYGRVSFQVLRDPQASAHAILALAARNEKIIYAGTDGGGIVELTIANDVITERSITSQPPNAPESLKPESPTSQEPVAPVITDNSAMMKYAGLGLFAAILILILFRVKAIRRSSKMKERRRNSREPFELPEISDLSSDIAAYARRFHEVTNHVNEITRELATSASPDLAARTGNVLSEFQTIEEWMKARLATIRMDRDTKSAELARMRTAMKSGGVTADLERSLTEIEEWLKVAHRDERYLKYVLEE